MSPKYWESSGDLSSDSSAESSQDEARDTSADLDEVPLESIGDVKSKGGGGPQDPNAGALSRVMATNFALPTLQPHQHASLFYLSLIEGRCRTQAATSINAGRRPEDCLPEDHPEICDLAQHLFTEMSKELVKAGMVPEEFVGRPLPELRLYLTSFDAILNTIATKRPQDISENDSFRAIDSANYISFHRDVSTSSIGSSQALIRRAEQQFAMAPLAQQSFLGPSQSPLFTILYPEKKGGGVQESIYASQYQQVAMLGRGGFGHVFKARYYLDNTEYAIKRIVIPSDRLQHLTETGRLRDLLSEVEALSKLNNPHVVRYYHSWLETRPATARSDGTDHDDEESGETLSLDSDVDSRIHTLTSQIESVQIGVERDFQKEMRKIRRNSTTHEAPEDMILFEEDSTPAAEKGKSAVKPKTVIKDKPEKLGFFKSVDESDDSDDDNGYEDEDESGSTVDIPRANTVSQVAKIDFDAVLYIKMAPYPLSLQDYIFPERERLALGMRHCFHILPTVRILLAILNGVEYLHRKQIIHRDLKPGNIFLSILEDSEPATDGYVDTTSCNECRSDCSTASGHISPCIGDFGLIADLKDLKSHTPGSSAAGSDSKPWPFSKEATHQAGTRLYCPPTVPKVEPIICPKVDVYSLGVIAFELLNKFTTRSERAMVLDNLRKGIFPKEFEKHEMAEGIKGMLCGERDGRWDCSMIRKWLVGLQSKFA